MRFAGEGWRRLRSGARIARMRALNPPLVAAFIAAATAASAQDAPFETVRRLEAQGRFDEAVDALERAAIEPEAPPTEARAWLVRALVYRTAGDDVFAATRALEALRRTGAPRSEVAAWELEIAAMHDRAGRWREGALAREAWLRRGARAQSGPAAESETAALRELTARAQEERCLAWDRVAPNGPLVRCPTTFERRHGGLDFPHIQYLGSVGLPLHPLTSNLASSCFFRPYGALGGGASGGGPPDSVVLLTAGHPGPTGGWPPWPRSPRLGDPLVVDVNELFREDMRASALAAWVLRRAGRTIDSLTATWLVDAVGPPRGRSPTRQEVRALDRALGYHFTARWLVGGAAPASEIFRQWALLSARLGAWSQAWLATHSRPVWNAGQLTWPEAVREMGRRMEAEHRNALTRCAEHARAELSLVQMRRCDAVAGRVTDDEVLPPTAAQRALHASIEHPLPAWSAVHASVLE